MAGSIFVGLSEQAWRSWWDSVVLAVACLTRLSCVCRAVQIEKSHQIVPKNEEKKKARMAPALLEAMARQLRAPNNNANIAAKAAPPKAPGVKVPAARKMAPPKLHNLAR